MTAPRESPAVAPPRRGRTHERVRRAWPVLRATLVTALLALWVLSALPSRPFDEARLARPTHARTVQGIRAALAQVGVTVSRAGVERALIALSTPLVEARNALVDPLAPVLDFAQMGQRWGLFLQTGRTAYRIEIAGRTAAAPFAVLYVPHEVDALGMGGTLAFRRLRGLYNPGAKGAPRAQFEGFCDWLAGEVFRARPDLVELRVRMERLRLGSRDEPNRVVDVAHESLRARRPGAPG